MSRRSRLIAALLAACLGIGLSVADIPTRTAAAAVGPGAASFDPIPSTVMGGDSIFGRVVTDGRGTFHAVARSDAGTQAIEYRRSVDGGVSWVVTARFAGDDGGATRPSISVWGDRVAIGYIGRYCVPGSLGVCDEAPYLVTSTDAGQTWGAPVRLDRSAFEVRVAIDGDRTWVAWQRGGIVELRGTISGGRTWFASRSTPGMEVQLAAADHVMVFAYQASDAAAGPNVVRTEVAIDQAVGAPRDIAGRFRFAAPDSVAAADGLVHVLIVDVPPPVPEPPTPILRVATAAGDGDFSGVVAVGPWGNSASISAARGTVGVALATRDGVTSVSTSSDGGFSFGAPEAVSVTPGSDPFVELGIANPGPQRPIARFDWSVAAHYTDDNGDGLPDPANAQLDRNADQLRIFGNGTLHVKLDGCGSLPAVGTTIARYTWFVDGNILAAGHDCKATVDVQDHTTVSVRLVIDDVDGDTGSVTQAVAPRDIVVVSIGDSVASGEGSPHVARAGRTPAVWQDGPCDRSAYAGPALAAKRLEDADPRTSVTFIQLACSGAAVVDTSPPTGIDDPFTGGLLDSYAGVSPKVGSLRPSQLDQMVTLLGRRHVDSLLVSVGANDARFSDVVKGCLVDPSCNVTTPTHRIRADFEQRLAQLPGRYNLLANRLDQIGVDPSSVHITEYFDPTSDDLGLADMRCVLRSTEITNMREFLLANSSAPLIGELLAAAGGGGVLNDDEAAWAHTGVIGALNDAVRAGALAHGWQFVGGIASRFDTHGYCAHDHWVVQLGESLEGQGDPNGAFHPNRAGQRVYGDAIFAALQGEWLLPRAPTSNGSTGGPGALGDMMVITTTHTTTTSVAVDSTGGRPLPLASRRLDRVALGEGSMFPAGPPALDGVGAVAMWTELSVNGSFTFSTRAGQIASRPNASVRAVRVLQAPADSTLLVADRPALVRATIDASIAAPEAVDVTTTVTATDVFGSTRELLAPTTEPVTLAPGRNEVLLPHATTFTAHAGEQVSATVKIVDPIGTDPAYSFDNELTTDSDHVVTAVTTRPLRVLFGSANVASGIVACADVAGLASRMASFASAAIPVAAGGVSAHVWCSPGADATQDDAGVLDALAWADELARYTQVDAVVLVVPDGWLQTAAGGAIGVAVPGMRAVLVEKSAPMETLSHELAHTYGVMHTPAPVAAAGARVDLRGIRAGVDWMAPEVQPKTWTGGHTWDQLLSGIGGPAHAPQPLNLNGGGVWIRGTVVTQADGTAAITSGQWIPDNSGPATDPFLTASANDTRLLAQQLNANGDPIGAAQPVSLAAVDGLFGASVTPGPAPVGYGFATRITLLPNATAVQLRLDGAVVLTRSISAAPTVAVDAPTSAVHVARGVPLTVSWTAHDPDGDPLTADVFVSDDAGDSWRPLAQGVVGNTVTMPLPADVGGDHVVVRVVTSDGVRAASAESQPFSAEGTIATERVVFVRGGYTSIGTRTQPIVATMKPDGTDVTPVPLPLSVIPLTAQGQDLCGQRIDCFTDYRDPVLSPDGAQVFFSADILNPTLDGPDPLTYEQTKRIWSVDIDGGHLQRITAPPSDTAYWGTDQFGRSRGSGDNVCPSVSPDGNNIAWLVSGSVGDGRIWTAHRVAAGWSRPTIAFDSGPQSAATMNSTFPSSSSLTIGASGPSDNFTADSCPHWTHDGAALVFVAPYVRYQPNGGTDSFFEYVPIVEITQTGPNAGVARVISPKSPFIQGTGGYSNFRWQTQFFESVAANADGSLTVGRGFEDTARFNPGGGLASSPKTFGAARLDPITSVVTRITPEPDTGFTERPYKLRVSPGGQLYADAAGFDASIPACPTVYSGLGVIDAASGALDRVQPAHTGVCGGYDHMFSWGVSSNGITGSPIVAVDPTADPPDPNEPIAVDVTTLTAPDPVPAPDADALPGRVVEVPADIAASVPAGATTAVTLQTVSGALSVFTVLSSTPAQVAVGVPVSTGAFETTTGIDGQILVTPAPGFLGMTTIGYVVAGTAGPVGTATITVTGNRPPIAEPDAIAAPQSIDTVIDPATLLANDHDPDSGDTLQVVSVSGADNGSAWLDVDGLVHVVPSDAGTARFTYVIADQHGALSLAGVTATVAAAATSTTTSTTSTSTSTSTSSTTSSTTTSTSSTSTTTTVPSTSSSTSTTSTTVATSTTVGPLGSTTSTTTVAPEATVAATPTTVDPGNASSGPLPFTGGQSRSVAMFALVCLVAGAFLVGRRRRFR